ncbi:claudin-3, partial [Silurus asotus]
MAALGLEILGISLSVLGWILSIVCCALPMWRVTAFIGTNIITAQVYWEGIWMSCVFQSTGQMQCKVYDSILALPQDLQAARALTIVAILLGVLALLVSIVGANPIVPEARKMEIGASLYLGWGAAAMLLVGGAILCCSCPPTERDGKYIPVNRMAYSTTNRSVAPSTYSRKDYLTMSMGMELGGIALGLIGWIISIITCALPMWKVTAFVGANIVTAQVIWEGIWMSCVVQSTGQMQCKIYDSMLALPQDLQAARAMCIVSIILGMLAALISIMGAKCTNCIEDEASKAKVMIVSGICFIISGVLTLIPVSWTSNTVVQDFYNPLVAPTQRRELGASLYIGFGAAALLIIGGALLCCTCPPRENSYKPPKKAYTAPRS